MKLTCDKCGFETNNIAQSTEEMERDFEEHQCDVEEEDKEITELENKRAYWEKKYKKCEKEMKNEEILKEVGVWIVYDLEANREIQKLLQKRKFAFRFDPSLEMTRQEKGKYCIKLIEQGKKIGEQAERKRIQRDYVPRTLITKPDEWISKKEILEKLKNADFGSYIICEGEAVFDVDNFIKKEVENRK